MLPTRTLLENNTDVSHMTVSRHLAKLDYTNSLPFISTPMLIIRQKRTRVEWARKHLHDNWENTVFLIKLPSKCSGTHWQWWKGERPTRCLPKNRTKVLHGVDSACVGRRHFFALKILWLAYFMLKYKPEMQRMLRDNWRFQQDNDPKHTSGMAQNFLKENFLKVID